MSILDAIRKEAKPDQCHHKDTISTVNFGLERVVCQTCGKVEMRHRDVAEPGVLFQVPTNY